MSPRTDTPVAVNTRRLGQVPWNQDGCRGIAIHAELDVPSFDDGMIRSALVRGSLVCETVEALGVALNRQLWAIGYVASVRPNLIDRSVAVQVSTSTQRHQTADPRAALSPARGR